MAWFNAKKNNPPTPDDEEEDYNEFDDVAGFDNDEITGIDTSKGIIYNNQSDGFGINIGSNKYDDSEDLNGDEDDYDNDRGRNDDDNIVSPSFKHPSTVVNQYRQIDSAQQGYNLIAGIDDVPLKYRDQNLLPELVGISLQYNNFDGNAELVEWQIKARSLIRQYQMNHPDAPLNGRDVAGITYMNDLFIWRSKNGFERKMCNSNLTGVIEENGTESSPRASQPQKRKGFLSSMFGGN